MSEKAPQAQLAAQPAKVTPFAGGKGPGLRAAPAAPQAHCICAAGKNHAFCRRATKPGSARTFSR